MSINTKILSIDEFYYTGAHQDHTVYKFVCMLCYGIVWKPIKCTKCDTLYCERCIPTKNLLPGRFNCYRKCGSDEYTRDIGKVLKNLHKNLLLTC